MSDLTLLNLDLDLTLDYTLFDDKQIMADMAEWAKEMDKEWQAMINETDKALALYKKSHNGVTSLVTSLVTKLLVTKSSDLFNLCE